MERPLRLESSVRTGKDVNGKLTMFFFIRNGSKGHKMFEGATSCTEGAS